MRKSGAKMKVFGSNIRKTNPCVVLRGTLFSHIKLQSLKKQMSRWNVTLPYDFSSPGLHSKYELLYEMYGRFILEYPLSPMYSARRISLDMFSSIWYRKMYSTTVTFHFFFQSNSPFHREETLNRRKNSFPSFSVGRKIFSVLKFPWYLLHRLYISCFVFDDTVSSSAYEFEAHK